MTEQRNHPRFCLWFPVTVEAETGIVLAVCNDASSGGIAINSAGPVAAGSEVTITFRTSPDDEPRHAKGTVIRVEPRSEDPHEVWAYRVAIEFHEPQPELQEVFRLRSSPPGPML